MQRKSPHQGKHYYVETEEGCGSGVESRRLSNEWNMYTVGNIREKGDESEGRCRHASTAASIWIDHHGSKSVAAATTVGEGFELGRHIAKLDFL